MSFHDLILEIKEQYRESADEFDRERLWPELDRRLGSRAVSRVAADRIQKAVSRPVELDDQKIAISCSIGIAYSPENGEDSATLLRAADAAMSSVKGAESSRRQVSPLWLPRSTIDRLASPPGPGSRAVRESGSGPLSRTAWALP